MIFNFSSFLLVWLSVCIFLASLIFDFEVICFTLPLLAWHLWNGVGNLINDYIYSKFLKLTLLFFLQISMLLTVGYFLNFLF